MNTSLKNPSNDYQQAQNYEVLQRLNPNASYLKIKEMEEGGMNTPGFLKETLKMNKEQYGENTDDSAVALKQRFTNLSWSQAEQLSKADYNDEVSLKSIVGAPETKESTRDKATKNVTAIEQQQANITEEFAKSMTAGLKEGGKQIAGEITKGIREITSDNALMRGIGENIAKGIEKYLGNSATTNMKNSTNK
jgi:hypothetical protein